MITYDIILQGHEASLENAREHILGLDWAEVGKQKYNGSDHSYIETFRGVEIYHHYGADYFFFADPKDND